MAISVKTGNLRGRFWLNDTDEELGFKYQDVAKLEKDEVESYYDMVAKDYARAMINWGYCMPEILSNAVVINGGVSPTSNIKVWWYFQEISSLFIFGNYFNFSAIDWIKQIFIYSRSLTWAVEMELLERR